MKTSGLPDLSKVIERIGKTLLVIVTVFAVLVLARFLLMVIGGSSLSEVFTSIFDFSLAPH
ncbi:MAG: hypothetical protein LBG19_05420 [Prevotellaceae bacterium]|jgi:hypothetical protein|nr:hypothetical protein [Prevotellaceae bacterium]